ncbi:MAG TPA: organoarsenical effux MFS transporter ArsJ [Motiliproteus sp.]
MTQDAAALRQYALVTGNYWAFTLTDGALRMLVVLYFHQLGYAPLAIALLFLFYEFFGIVTNLVGGWLGARIGLNRTMNMGLALQVLALGMLAVPPEWLSVGYVMAAQALSGIAKDLNKMSAKSSVKLLAGSAGDAGLYRWVALLTGSKNALKGVGFFLGGALLAGFGFQQALLTMAALLALILGASLLLLQRDLGVAKHKAKFRDIFSKSRAINLLSAARLFLFGARDIWFVVALPVFMSAQLGWSHAGVGAFMACWVIGYGVVQGLAPALTGKRAQRPPDGAAALQWALLLTLVPAAIALGLNWLPTAPLLLGGLLLFGVVFALNSALHSYLILAYSSADGVSLDVGFYYMANAAGRLLGTLLSGWLYQQWGMAACLWGSAAMLLLTVLISTALPRLSPCREAQKSPR